MNNKILSGILVFVLFVGVFTFFITVANAKDSDIFSSKQQTMTIILKDNADINISKNKISKIPKVRIIRITDRNKEWSKMVNKMDLPKMDNPFKNEVFIKLRRNASVDEIYNKIKELDFVVDIKYP